jgi:hypothetical protein
LARRRGDLGGESAAGVDLVGLHQPVEQPDAVGVLLFSRTPV